MKGGKEEKRKTEKWWNKACHKKKLELKEHLQNARKEEKV